MIYVPKKWREKRRTLLKFRSIQTPILSMNLTVNLLFESQRERAQSCLTTSPALGRLASQPCSWNKIRLLKYKNWHQYLEKSWWLFAVRVFVKAYLIHRDCKKCHFEIAILKIRFQLSDVRSNYKTHNNVGENF